MEKSTIKAFLDAAQEIITEQGEFYETIPAAQRMVMAIASDVSTDRIPEPDLSVIIERLCALNATIMATGLKSPEPVGHPGSEVSYADWLNDIRQELHRISDNKEPGTRLCPVRTEMLHQANRILDELSPILWKYSA